MQSADIQVRMKNGRLHIQGAGPEINRGYGVAGDVQVPDELADWMANQDHEYESLAGSEAVYVGATARIHEDVNGVEIIIEGEPLNVEDGVSITVKGVSALVDFVQQYEG